MGDLLVQNGEVISYAVVGVLALFGLLIVQLFRRRGDRKKAETAVRLASYSVVAPRPGPIAVRGPYHQTADERWISSHGQRVDLSGPIEIVRGTKGRWQGGTRTYTVKQGDEVIAIGVMSRGASGSWQLVSSPGEAGVQVFAAEPRPAPAPLLPWRAPLILAVLGAIFFFGLAAVAPMVGDVGTDCSDSAKLRLQIANALPQGRDEALAKLARCK